LSCQFNAAADNSTNSTVQCIPGETPPPPPPPPPQQEICDNGIDDDGDGAIDAEDTDCQIVEPPANATLSNSFINQLVR
jgi:hypothetical protein